MSTDMERNGNGDERRPVRRRQTKTRRMEITQEKGMKERKISIKCRERETGRPE